MNKKDQTRQLILEKAAPIFNTKGLAATSMSDIMEATRLSKGSLYVHFEDKEALAAEIVDYSFQQMGEKLKRVLSSAKTAKEKLLAYIDFFKTPVTPPMSGGCPMLNFGMEADDTNPHVKDKVHQASRKSQQLITDIIQKGIADGEFKSGWDYKEFATIMFAMLEGGQLICRVAGNNSKMNVIAGSLRKMIDAHTT